MLSFFRVNAPYQYASLVALLALIRLPLLLHPTPLLLPELNWMLVGERMGQGHMLYRDIWDSVSPLSGLVYWLTDAAFGRSQVAYHVLATAVSLFQIVYFNYVMNSRDVLPDRNFWPGLLYMLFMNLSTDCTTLSPVLLSTSLLLLAFGTLIRQMERRGATDEVFEVGFYVGLATLFYLPSALFIIWAAASLLFFTGTTFRQHSLSLFGFLFPILLTLLYYYFNDGLNEFNRNLLASVFRVQHYNLTDFGTLLAALTIPLGVGVLGFFSLFNAPGRYVNFQQRCQQIMLLWFLTAVLTIPLMPLLAPMQFLGFLPPMAFFAVLYLQNIRRAWLAELAFWGIALGVVLVFYQSAISLVPGVDVGRLTRLEVPASALSDRIRNRRVLVFGNDLSAYRYNSPATPYLNWELAKYDLDQLDNYDAVIHVYDYFRNDPPDYLIDSEHIAGKLFRRAPALASQYQPTPLPDVYKHR